MDVADWVSASCAALALVFAVLSWWWQVASRRARAEAQAARDDATRQADAMEALAIGVRRLSARPEIEATQGADHWIELVSQVPESVSVVATDLPDFFQPSLRVPFTLEAFGMKRFYAEAMLSERVPDQIALTLSGGRVVHVAIRRTT